jgi:serine/tyrosine/threonine adenylyltransferase
MTDPFADRPREPRIALADGYGRLPARFYAQVHPTRVANPTLICVNHDLAAELGLPLATLDEDELAALFSGNRLPAHAQPIAVAYAGHQFGHFVPQLGDGRAILLGEAIDRQSARRELQLKGSGRTPYSRGGDGRAALGPVLREYLVSEAMHALGIPTTRALAAVTTGESVQRDTLLPGAILTRVAASHVRVGTFQYFAAREDLEGLRLLADYAIDRHEPAAGAASAPYLALLRGVMQRQAALVARWMHVGFIHGVMNTDNSTISGETIDFGPCAFMDAYDPQIVFSSIDRGGRYAYANQPHAAQWNLARLAEALLPLIDADTDRAVELASEVVTEFAAVFATAWLAGMRLKIGLHTAQPDDAALVQTLLDAMHANRADHTLTFRRMCDAAAGTPAADAVRELFANPGAWDAWATAWRARLAREPMDPVARAQAMRRVNPALIPRNHRVEEVLEAAVTHGDFAPFEALLTALLTPFEPRPEGDLYSRAPGSDERVIRTFCGT